MKFFVFFLIMLVGMTSFISGQTRRNEITVDGFLGDSPLNSDQTVIVNYSERGMQGVWELVRKGETLKSFLLRLKADSAKAVNGYYDSLINKINEHNKSKRVYLTLGKLQDSLMMAYAKGGDVEPTEEQKIPVVASVIAEKKTTNEIMNCLAALGIIYLLFFLMPHLVRRGLARHKNFRG